MDQRSLTHRIASFGDWRAGERRPGTRVQTPDADWYFESGEAAVVVLRSPDQWTSSHTSPFEDMSSDADTQPVSENKPTAVAAVADRSE